MKIDWPKFWGWTFWLLLCGFIGGFFAHTSGHHRVNGVIVSSTSDEPFCDFIGVAIGGLLGYLALKWRSYRWGF